MPQDSTRDIILSFADFVATAALPGVAGKVVSTLLPKIADMVFPVSSLESYVKSAKDGAPSVDFSQTIVLQDGTKLLVTIGQETTPLLHEKLMEIYSEKTSAAGSGSGLSRSQAFFPYTSIPVGGKTQTASKVEPLGSGGVSILNGIIGINW